MRWALTSGDSAEQRVVDRRGGDRSGGRCLGGRERLAMAVAVLPQDLEQPRQPGMLGD